MKGNGPIQSFRGKRALLLHPADENCGVLERTLGRLGLAVERLEPAGLTTVPESLTLACDVFFVDADAGGLPDWSATAPPIVAVIGHETPSRLVRVHEMGANGFVLKPVRVQGVYSALFIAINAHRRLQHLGNRIAELEQRHGARRHVVKAILSFMEQHGVDEDNAFRMLRRESMARRLTIEEFSRQYVEAIAAATRRRVMGG
jgi:AmiR/NasT family two-component response regulator